MEKDDSLAVAVHFKDSSDEVSLPPSDQPQIDLPANPSESILTEGHGRLKLSTQPSTNSAGKPSRSSSKSKDSSRVSPTVGAYTVQCVKCLKWRLIPSKEQYEDIRHSAIEEPFVCSKVCSWRPNVSCEDPADLSQDESKLWIIDKPNIPRTPSGWERLLAIRGEGACRFADVYYITPSGKKLRSMVEVEKFLDENPQFVKEGVTISQFNYQIPRPLHQEYVKKRATPDARIEPNAARTGKRRISAHERN